MTYILNDLLTGGVTARAGLGIAEAGTGPNQGVVLDANSKLPAVDGSALINLTAASIADGAITLAKLANMATSAIYYRKTAGDGAPEVNTLATLKTDLGLTGTNSGDQTTVSGNAGSATVLQTARNINGVSFNGSADITIAAAGSTLTGTSLAAGITSSSLTSFGASIALGTPASGTLTNCTFPTLNQNTTGSAATLTTARTLWGVSFDGSANISGSMTSLGDLTGGASSMTITAGTGNSRTLILRTTTSGGTATTALTLNADQSATFAGSIDLSTKNIITDTSTGTKIGTATTQKIGFFNVTPVVQPTAYTQTYATASKTLPTQTSADFPAGGTGAAAGAWSTAANRDLAITRFNALRTDLDNTKKVLNQVIDDLQALGLLS